MALLEAELGDDMHVPENAVGGYRSKQQARITQLEDALRVVKKKLVDARLEERPEHIKEFITYAEYVIHEALCL